MQLKSLLTEWKPFLISSEGFTYYRLPFIHSGDEENLIKENSIEYFDAMPKWKSARYYPLKNKHTLKFKLLPEVHAEIFSNDY